MDGIPSPMVERQLKTGHSVLPVVIPGAFVVAFVAGGDSAWHWMSVPRPEAVVCESEGSRRCCCCSSCRPSNSNYSELHRVSLQSPMHYSIINFLIYERKGKVLNAHKFPLVAGNRVMNDWPSCWQDVSRHSPLLLI